MIALRSLSVKGISLLFEAVASIKGSSKAYEVFEIERLSIINVCDMNFVTVRTSFGLV